MKEVGIITLSELNDMAASMYGDLVKAVVDATQKDFRPSVVVKIGDLQYREMTGML